VIDVEIVLVRHAQPDWEPDGRAVDEPGLTVYGHRQAECAARCLAGDSFDHFYVSPFRRALETAAPIAKALGMEPLQQSWLREMGLPSLEGQTSEQVQAYFEQAHARELDHWWDGLPGGESFRHFYERVSGGLEGLLAGVHGVRIHEDAGHRLWRLDDAPARILIVAHEGTNAVLLSHLLGIEPVPWAPMRFSNSWAGITRIHSLEIAGGWLWSLESFNRVSHLDALVDGHPGDGRSPTLIDPAG
jgi:probable phosphoglycerate mutase